MARDADPVRISRRTLLRASTATAGAVAAAAAFGSSADAATTFI